MLRSLKQAPQRLARATEQGPEAVGGARCSRPHGTPVADTGFRPSSLMLSPQICVAGLKPQDRSKSCEQRQLLYWAQSPQDAF